MRLPSWTRREPADARRHHIVHFDPDRRSLLDAASAWLLGALAQEGGAIVLARPESIRALRHTLALHELDTTAIERRGRLAFLDPHDVIGRAGPTASPDGSAFRAIVNDTITSVERACGPHAPRVRAWGEMVDILWGRSDIEGARSVEGWWNEFLEHRRVDLLCSYTLAAAGIPTAQLATVCEHHDEVVHRAAWPPAGTAPQSAEAPDTTQHS